MGTVSSSENLPSKEKSKATRIQMKKQLLDNINIADSEGMPNKILPFKITNYLKKVEQFKLFQGKSFSGENITLTHIILDDISFEQECLFREEVQFYISSIESLKKNEIYSEWAHSFVIREREFYEILTISKRCSFFYMKDFTKNLGRALIHKLDDLNEKKILGILHNLISMMEDLQENKIWPRSTLTLEDIYFHKGILVVGELTQFQPSGRESDDNRGKLIISLIEELISRSRYSLQDMTKIAKILDYFDYKMVTLMELKKYVSTNTYYGKINLEIVFEDFIPHENKEAHDLSNMWESLILYFSIGHLSEFERKVVEFQNMLDLEKGLIEKYQIIDFYQTLANNFRYLGEFKKSAIYFDKIEDILNQNPNSEFSRLRIHLSLNKAALSYDIEAFNSMEEQLREGFDIIEVMNDSSKERITAKIVLYGVGFCLLNEIKGYRRESLKQFNNIKELMNKQFDKEPMLKALIHRIVGDSFRRMGESEEAKNNYLQTLEFLDSMGKENHPHKSITKRNLGSLLVEMGEINDAFYYLECALDENESYYSSKSIEYNDCLNALAYAYLKLNKRKAEDLFKITFEVYVRYLGKYNKKSIECMNNIGSLLLEREKFNEAFAYFKLAFIFAQESLKQKGIKISRTKKSANNSLNVSSIDQSAIRNKKNEQKIVEESFMASYRNVKAVDYNAQEYFNARKNENLMENTLIITILNNLYITSVQLGLNLENKKNLQDAFLLCKNLKNTHNTDLVVNALYSNTLLSLSDKDIENRNFALSFERINESIHNFDVLNPGNPSKIKAVNSYLLNLATLKSIEEALIEGEKIKENLMGRGILGKLDLIEIDLTLATICSLSPISSQKGLNLIKECERLIESHLSQNDPLILKMLNSRGACLLSLEFYKEAKAVLKDVLKKSRIAKLKQEEAICLSNLGMLYFKNNQLRKSKSYFKKAISIKKQIREDISLSNSYNNLGNIYILQENRYKAIMNYGHSLKIRRQMLPLDNMRIWSLIGNMRQCISFSISEENYMNMIYDFIVQSYDEFEASEKCMEQYGGTLVQGAGALCKLGKYNDAKDVLQKGIERLKAKKKEDTLVMEKVKACLFSLS